MKIKNRSYWRYEMEREGALRKPRVKTMNPARPPEWKDRLITIVSGVVFVAAIVWLAHSPGPRPDPRVRV